jgi:hypothetical protein
MTGAYSDNVAQMQSVVTPGGIGSESLALSLAGELERLRFVLNRIVGKATQWYDAPSTSLETLFTSGGLQALSFSRSLVASGDLSPAQITANQNDYAPTGHANAFRFRLDTDAARTLTGLAGGVAGRIVVLTYIGTTSLNLSDQDVLSTAANRFLMGFSCVLRPNRSIALQYDGTSSRWRPIQDALLDSQTLAGNLVVAGTTDLTGLLTSVNQKSTGFHDLAEIASPANPAASVGRFYMKNVGGVSIPFIRDNAGNDRSLLGGSQLLSSGSFAAPQATLDISLVGFTGFRRFKIILDRIIPVTDDVRLFMQLSTDGGSSFISANYNGSVDQTSSSSTGGTSGFGAAASAPLDIFAGAGDKVSNTATRGGLYTEITLVDTTNAAVNPHYEWLGNFISSNGGAWRIHGAGVISSLQDIDAIRILPEGGGNLASGKWAVIGIL